MKEIYAELIMKGLKTIDDVPKTLQRQVLKLLEQDTQQTEDEQS